MAGVTPRVERLGGVGAVVVGGAVEVCRMGQRHECREGENRHAAAALPSGGAARGAFRHRAALLARAADEPAHLSRRAGHD